MNQQARQLGPIALMVGALCTSGCSDCGCGEAPEVIARLTQASGAVERDHAAALDQWDAASSGATFVLGDGLRTGADGTARVSLTRGGGLRMGNDSFVRFVAGVAADAPQRLQVDLGEVEVRTDEAAVDVQTPSSRVRVESGSSLAVDYGESDHARFEVTLGQARYFPRESDDTTDADQGVALEQGEAVVVDRQTGRVVDRVAAGTGPRAATRDSAGGEEAAASEDQRPTVALRVTGEGARIRGPEERSWRPLPAGDVDVEAGSRLRLARGTTVALRRGSEQATLVGSAEASVGAGGALVRMTSGQATAEAGGSAVSIAVAGGVILLRPRARTSVSIEEDGGATVRALAGETELRGGAGAEPVTLAAGQQGTLSPDEGRAGREPEPTRATMTLTAGSSGFIHDPNPPTALGLRVGDACPIGGVVEITRGEEEELVRTIEGQDRVITSLHPGAYQYRLFCTTAGVRQRSPASTGRLRIMHDPGTSPMGVAGHNVVDADGRNYTIRYDTTPPSVTFRWSRAPEAEQYRFHLQAPSGSISRQVSRPRFTASSGTLGGGSCTFFFTTPSGGRSPQTRLTLRVERSVVVASIRSPSNRAASPGAPVQVSGVARPGSTVTVGGQSIPFESPTRFSGQVTAPSDEGALTIRIADSTGGVHYFLRRLAGGSGE